MATVTDSAWEPCYPDGKTLHDGDIVDGWCHQCGHLKLAHHITGQCALCQIIAAATTLTDHTNTQGRPA
jgi:hypothetical protein